METILIIGRAPCWEEDLKNIESIIGIKYDIVAVGEDCPYEGHVDYLATYHHNGIPLYKKSREEKGLNTDYKVVSHLQPKNEKDRVDYICKYEPPSGSSALLGTLMSLQLGYTKIVLVGCPLEGKNNHGHSYSVFRIGWKEKYDYIKDYVRSMSGWTKELLGEPTKEWWEQGKKI